MNSDVSAEFMGIKRMLLCLNVGLNVVTVEYNARYHCI